MVVEHTMQHQMVQHSLEYLKMVKDMKEFLLIMMETNILVIGKLMKIGITHSGTEQDMTKTETLSKSM